MNVCRSCDLDFASVAAFDRHRIGTHAYTFGEGLDRVLAREDGRRCMDSHELVDAGMELDQHGRWRIRVDDAQRERFAVLREAS